MVNFKQLLLSKLNQRKGNILNINFTWYVYSLLFKLHIISPDSPHVNEPFIFFVALSPFCKWPLQNLWVRKGKWCHSQTTSKVQNYVHTTQLAVEPWLNLRCAVLESKAPPLLPRKKEKKKKVIMKWSTLLSSLCSYQVAILPSRAAPTCNFAMQSTGVCTEGVRQWNAWALKLIWIKQPFCLRGKSKNISGK